MPSNYEPQQFEQEHPQPVSQAAAAISDRPHPRPSPQHPAQLPAGDVRPQPAEQPPPEAWAEADPDASQSRSPPAPKPAIQVSANASLSPADIDMLNDRFVPVVYEDLTELQEHAMREAQANYKPVDHGPGVPPPRDYKPTVPRPFHFEERAKMRPKFISEVRGIKHPTHLPARPRMPILDDRVRVHAALEAQSVTLPTEASAFSTLPTESGTIHATL